VGLLGCKVEVTNLDNDSDENQVLFVTRDMSAEDETIDKNDLYDFELKGEQNRLILKGNLRQVFIIGSSNDVTISEDSYIERLVIEGGNNILSMGENDVVIGEVVIEGDNNFLTFSQCNQLSDLGENNQVAFLQDTNMEGTGCEINDDILTNNE
jgi:hypothetical protein